MGTPDFAVGTLERLNESCHEIVSVVTRPDRPKGRGQRVMPQKVKITAQRLNLPILQPHSLRDPKFLNLLVSLDADLFVVVAFQILPRVLLFIPKKGSINLHPSLLPRFRGAAPINWALIRGEIETGVTTFYLKPKVDAGDIIFQRRTPIGPNETAGELGNRLKLLGADLVLETVNSIGRGEVVPVVQRESEVTSAPKLKKEHGLIDWGLDANSIQNLIRGTNPFPGAFTEWRGGFLKIHLSSISEGDGMPGEVVVSDSKNGIVVASGDGALALLEVQPAGKRRISGAEFCRGYKIKVGERFGRD